MTKDKKYDNIWVVRSLQFSSKEMMMTKKELQLDEEFQLTAPKGENQDEDSDSLGELSTNEAIVIDDLRDLIDDTTFQQEYSKKPLAKLN